MKTKEELNILKDEIKTFSAKFAELTEDELDQVAAGSTESDLEADFYILISKAGVALTRAQNTTWVTSDPIRKDACRKALEKTREALQEKLAGVPWNFVKNNVDEALAALNGVTGDDFDIARAKLEECSKMLEGY